MKKLMFSFFVFLSFNFSSKAQSSAYDNGFTNGYNLGYSSVDQIVINNPAYGWGLSTTPTYSSVPAFGTYNSYSPNNSSGGAATYSAWTFDLSGSYSDWTAGNRAINDLYSSGTISWLEENAKNGEYENGVYNGFIYGCWQWLYNHL